MENKTKTLEQKIEKIDWKEWIPGYGAYLATKNNFYNKPNMFNPRHPDMIYGYITYQMISTFLTVAGLRKLSEFVF